VEALDNKLITNLARELPYLTKRIAQVRLGCDETDYFHQLRDWEHFLERITSRIRSLPVLISTIPDIQLSKSERRLRVAKLKHAVTLLSSLKLMVAELEQDKSAVPIERLQLEMSDVVYELELVIRQRAQGVEDA
jgi:replicative DNA helicase